MSPDDFSLHMRWVNVLDTFPGKQGRGDRFPMLLARKRTACLVLAETTVLLGTHVARAFGLPAWPFIWHAVRGCHVAVVPHPSGLNRWYNDPANRARCGDFLRAALNLPS